MTIAFYLPGRIPVYAFSLLLGGGAALGLAWMVRNPDGRSYPGLAGALFTLLGALTGARVGYLAVNWAYYDSHSAELLQLPLGGLSWGGGLAGAALAAVIAAPVLGISPFKLLDHYFPLFALTGASAWLGCWLDGCAYGPLATSGIALLGRDEWGNLAGRYPVQLLAVLFAVLTLLAFDLTRRSVRIPGLPGAFWLSALALQTWWLSGLRVDPAPTWQGERLDLWAARFFVLATTALLAGVLVNTLLRRAGHEGAPAAG